jgi:hypothetical protein
MPNIVMTSPRNNNSGPGGLVQGTTTGATGSAVSIERINKNISDSINNNKGGNGVTGGGAHNKEIQLI